MGLRKEEKQGERRGEDTHSTAGGGVRDFRRAVRVNARLEALCARAVREVGRDGRGDGGEEGVDLRYLESDL